MKNYFVKKNKIFPPKNELKIRNSFASFLMKEFINCSYSKICTFSSFFLEINLTSIKIHTMTPQSILSCNILLQMSIQFFEEKKLTQN